MPRTLVTVKGSRHIVDLELPADAPAQELMASLLVLCEHQTLEMAAQQGMRWGLGLDGGMPIAPQRTLRDAGVLDGARLLLHPLDSWISDPAPGAAPAYTPPASQRPPAQQEPAPGERRSITIHWDTNPPR